MDLERSDLKLNLFFQTIFRSYTHSASITIHSHYLSLVYDSATMYIENDDKKILIMIWIKL